MPRNDLLSLWRSRTEHLPQHDRYDLADHLLARVLMKIDYVSAIAAAHDQNIWETLDRLRGEVREAMLETLETEAAR